MVEGERAEQIELNARISEYMMKIMFMLML